MMTTEDPQREVRNLFRSFNSRDSNVRKGRDQLQCSYLNVCLKCTTNTSFNLDEKTMRTFMASKSKFGHFLNHGKRTIS